MHVAAQCGEARLARLDRGHVMHSSAQAVWWSALAFFALTWVWAGTALARQPSDPVDWEQLYALSGVVRLYTPTSGALLATTAKDELLRSDDGGVTWRVVNHPTDTNFVNVDPADHNTLYAGGSLRAYKSIDGGVNWKKILDGQQIVANMVVSPADHDLIFVVTQGPGGQGIGLLRSANGGSTWTELESQATGDCSMSFLAPHPANSKILFRTRGCNLGNRGYNLYASAQVSRDAGDSWMPGGFSSFASKLSGGRHTDPNRLYVSANGERTGTARGAWLDRSDDGGQRWERLLALDTAGTYDPQVPPFDAWIEGLACDPSEPDHVFLAVAGPDAGVRASTDGGLTWSALGSQDLSSVRDLAVGIDGRYVFAASDSGIWRFALGGSSKVSHRASDIT
jgi:hypothetical protein